MIITTDLLCSDKRAICKAVYNRKCVSMYTKFCCFVFFIQFTPLCYKDLSSKVLLTFAVLYDVMNHHRITLHYEMLLTLKYQH